MFAISSVCKYNRDGLSYLDIKKYNVCGHPGLCKKNLQGLYRRGLVLTSVRPVLRLYTRRWPIWEYADRIHSLQNRILPKAKKLCTFS